MATDWRDRLRALAGRRNCRVTTRGRKSGKPHAVTVWFALVDESTVGLATLRMDRDWPKNLARNGEVQIAIGDLEVVGRARLVNEDTAARARVEEALRRKYLVSRVLGWLGFGAEGVFEVQIDGARR